MGGSERLEALRGLAAHLSADSLRGVLAAPFVHLLRRDPYFAQLVFDCVCDVWRVDTGLVATAFAAERRPYSNDDWRKMIDRRLKAPERIDLGTARRERARGTLWGAFNSVHDRCLTRHA